MILLLCGCCRNSWHSSICIRALAGGVAARARGGRGRGEQRRAARPSATPPRSRETHTRHLHIELPISRCDLVEQSRKNASRRGERTALPCSGPADLDSGPQPACFPDPLARVRRRDHGLRTWRVMNAWPICLVPLSLLRTCRALVSSAIAPHRNSIRPDEAWIRFSRSHHRLPPCFVGVRRIAESSGQPHANSGAPAEQHALARLCPVRTTGMEELHGGVYWITGDVRR